MKDYTGVLESQESAMLAVMLPFTNYDVPHANKKIRKIIAKKKMKEIASAREEYFATGAANGVSEDILKYIWDVQIKRQLGYSFQYTTHRCVFLNSTTRNELECEGSHQSTGLLHV